MPDPTPRQLAQRRCDRQVKLAKAEARLARRNAEVARLDAAVEAHSGSVRPYTHGSTFGCVKPWQRLSWACCGKPGDRGGQRKSRPCWRWENEPRNCRGHAAAPGADGAGWARGERDATAGEASGAAGGLDSGGIGHIRQQEAATEQPTIQNPTEARVAVLARSFAGQKDVLIDKAWRIAIAENGSEIVASD